MFLQNPNSVCYLDDTPLAMAAIAYPSGGAFPDIKWSALATGELNDEG
ncbi:MAG: hypothetical protein F6K00_14365 [Leptolyngbya sp. SIOISBB]|nr:hypothetical protein [Leptolyngbya sp. SIOISBB]